MGIWQRIVRLVRSLFSRGESMDQLSDRMDRTYREQTALLQQVRRGVADLSTSRRRVEVQLTTLQQQLAGLDAQAREAVAAGDDPTARAALGQRIGIEKAVAELTERHTALQADERKLEQTADQVESQVEQFRVRKDTLTARRAAATARSEVASATTGIAATTSGVGQAMAAAEQHTRELDATADAVDELVAEGVVNRAGEDARAAELRRFDAETAEIERQLDDMRSGDRGTQSIQE